MLSTEYRLPIASGDLVFGASVNHQDEAQTDVFNSARTQMHERSLVSLSIALEERGGLWSLRAFVANATDERYRIAALPVARLWNFTNFGARFAPHRHLSNSEYYVTRGELLYDVGSAPEGTYGYEPVGSVHTQARCEVDTEMLFIGRGAVVFTGEASAPRFILDNEFLHGITAGNIDADIS